VTSQQHRVLVLHEVGPDLRAHPSPQLRLLRPLTHPSVRTCIDATFARRLDPDAADAADVVIIDRLWRTDISCAELEAVVRRIRGSGARLVHTIDDNLLDHHHETDSWVTAEHRAMLEHLAREADAVVVTTAQLAARYAGLNPRVTILPNALDERLIIAPPPQDERDGARPLVLGYMGTTTHDDDLQLILPAFERLCARSPRPLQLQIIGIVARAATERAFARLPVRVVGVHPNETDYPLFMLWFTSRVRWDITLAPLRDNAFTRCKSDIKLLDYSAIGAAGIYSRVPAYESSVEHGVTGWLTENEPDAWHAAMEELVAHDALRRSIAENARKALYGGRTLARCATAWVAALDRVVGDGDRRS
jgi:glycosyltransferase involved in cell wall biosynthesis